MGTDQPLLPTVNQPVDNIKEAIRSIMIVVQGVVTPIKPVDPSMTGIKMKTKDQVFICAKSSDQGMLQRDQAC